MHLSTAFKLKDLPGNFEQSVSVCVAGNVLMWLVEPMKYSTTRLVDDMLHYVYHFQKCT